MLNLRKITIDYFIEELKKAYRRTYSDMEPPFGNIIAWSGRLALENIANSDALYHNVEHTIMVTLVGQAILEGKHLCEGGVTPRDWMHCTIALLCHDIGYVKGVCKRDGEGIVATGIGEQTVEIAPEGTDAALTPYHVDRSKQFVYERFGGELLDGAHVDAEVLASYIEMTRFPVPDEERYRDTKLGGNEPVHSGCTEISSPDAGREGVDRQAVFTRVCVGTQQHTITRAAAVGREVVRQGAV